MPDVVLVYAEVNSLSPLASSLAITEDGKVAAYVCKNKECQLPVRDPQKLTELLDAK